MQKQLLMLSTFMAAAGLAVGQAPAPLNLDIVATGATYDGLNAGGANGEFDGVSVRPDESRYYLFDSISTFDGVFASDGPTVVAKETAPPAGAFDLSAGSGSSSAGDMDSDTTNLYISTFNGSRNIIWRVPHAGPFTSAAEMVASASTVNLDEVSVDSKNIRLIMTYNDAFAAVASEDIVQVALTATGATPTVLATETALEAALATVTGYGGDANDDINIYDHTVQSDGDIIASHGFMTSDLATPGRQVMGTLLRITETGTVSVFRTGDAIITAAGGNPATADIGSVNVYTLQDNKILIHVNGATSGTGTLIQDEFIAVLSADGTQQTMLATDAQLTADPDVNTTIVPPHSGTGAATTIMHNGFRNGMDNKSGDVAADDDYYFYRQSQGGLAVGNAVLRLSGVRAFLSAGIGDWTMY
ncbi:MAG: hypothetical protein ACR2IE_11880 [Candidatus Sumerlaeaceae bacterium]